MERIPRPRQGDGGDLPDIETGLSRTPSERSVVVPCRPETDHDRAPHGLEFRDKSIVLGTRVGPRQAPAAASIGQLDQGLVAPFRDGDADKNRS